MNNFDLADGFAVFQGLDAVLYRGDGRSHKPGDHCSLTLTEDSLGFSKGLCLTAELAPDVPLFKIQSGFPRKNALELTLSLEGEPEFLAIYQHKDWWLRPAFLKGTAQIPERTQLLIWQQDGEYQVLMALCGKQYRSDFRTGDHGVTLRMSSNRDGMMRCEGPVFAYASGKDPYRCLEDAAALVLKMTGSPNRLRKYKRFPDILKDFGWCSWDAFYHQVSAQGIYDKLGELGEKGLPVKWALIDDGWSQADYQKQELTGLDADLEKFPGGLRETTRRIRQDYGVEHIGVWHALMGYWNGIKSGSDAEAVRREAVQTLADGRVVPDPEKSFQFWNRWHSYLAEQGIDFVKVDGQSAVTLFHGGGRTFGEGSRAMQDGLAGSAAMSFDGNIINCMGMAPEDFWNRTGALCRSSDDFVPEVPHGFGEHALQNGYNSLLHGQLCWGDWDMFWSSHEEAWQNAVLRAVSGGPVYISDKVGATDPAAICPLILDNGRVLRCDGVGVPTVDCLLTDPVTSGKPLKLFNFAGTTCVVGAFSIGGDETGITGSLGLEDIPALKNGPHLVYYWKERRAEILEPGKRLEFSMTLHDAALFLLVPLDSFVPLGLVEKFVSTAAITDQFRFGDAWVVLLAQGGEFAFWSEKKPKVWVNGSKTLCKNLGGGLYSVECPGNGKSMVQIDC